MIDRSFLEKIEEMSRIDTLISSGAIYSKSKLHLVPPPTPVPLSVHSLTAIVDYFTGPFIREQISNGGFVHVISYDTVAVSSELSDNYRARENYMRADLNIDPYPFGVSLPVEKFIIALQAQFVPSDNVSAILKVVGNITAEAEQKTLDDGVSQQITAKAGIATVKNVTLPNPITLAPYRTFPEIDQPESKFVLRINAKVGEKPTISLHEADGGAWKNEAIRNIKNWLTEKLPKGTTVLA